jgi:hyperosmotically inducible periplasmic protein
VASTASGVPPGKKLVLDRASLILGLALGASLALSACERTDQSALYSDAKKLAEETGTAAHNAARKLELDAKKATDTAIQVAGDTAIAARVKAALLAEKNVKSADVSVDTFQGRVILRGTVPDAEQIALAGQVARAVGGVKSVDNRLVVN